MKTKKVKCWKPVREEKYYTIQIIWGQAYVEGCPFRNDEDTQGRRKDGNLYRTKREATAALKRVKAALKEIR